MQNNHRAFARSIALFDEIRRIIDAGRSPLHQLTQINQLPEYKSRGKGGKFHGMVPNYHLSTSKYMPHQGKRECARRMAAMA